MRTKQTLLVFVESPANIYSLSSSNQCARNRPIALLRMWCNVRYCFARVPCQGSCAAAASAMEEAATSVILRDTANKEKKDLILCYPAPCAVVQDALILLLLAFFTYFALA